MNAYIVRGAKHVVEPLRIAILVKMITTFMIILVTINALLGISQMKLQMNVKNAIVDVQRVIMIVQKVKWSAPLVMMTLVLVINLVECLYSMIILK